MSLSIIKMSCTLFTEAQGGYTGDRARENLSRGNHSEMNTQLIHRHGQHLVCSTVAIIFPTANGLFSLSRFGGFLKKYLHICVYVSIHTCVIVEVLLKHVHEVQKRALGVLIYHPHI